jgi:hypothetical protein
MWTHFEQLPDRLMVRHPSKSVTPEGAHRDVSPSVPGQRHLVFGGWINLNEFMTHHFTCVPGSQPNANTNVNNTGAGFKPLSKAEKSQYDAKMEKIGTAFFIFIFIFIFTFHFHFSLFTFHFHFHFHFSFSFSFSFLFVCG